MPIIQGNHHRHHSSHHADTQNNPQPPPAPPQPRQSLPNPKLYTNSGPRNLLFIFLKWIIMAFILSLFLIFLGFTALVLLHFLFTHTTVHRHSRRHRQRQQSQTHQYFRNSIDPNSSYSLQDLHNLLPHLNYSVSSLKTRDCAICLEGFKEGEVCRKLPDCTHLFHRNCVDNWLVKVPTCPICRTRVRLDSGAWGSKK